MHTLRLTCLIKQTALHKTPRDCSLCPERLTISICYSHIIDVNAGISAYSFTQARGNGARVDKPRLDFSRFEWIGDVQTSWIGAKGGANNDPETGTVYGHVIIWVHPTTCTCTL